MCCCFDIRRVKYEEGMMVSVVCIFSLELVTGKSPLRDYAGIT